MNEINAKTTHATDKHTYANNSKHRFIDEEIEADLQFDDLLIKDIRMSNPKADGRYKSNVQKTKSARYFSNMSNSYSPKGFTDSSKGVSYSPKGVSYSLKDDSYSPKGVSYSLKDDSYSPKCISYSLIDDSYSPKDVSALFERIGYKFDNEYLLFNALCRVAFARENDISLKNTMDYLAVLGDAVIEILVIQSIIESGVTDKGEITRQKINKVNMSVLRTLAESIGLPDIVYWGKGEVTMKIWESGRVSAECFEALMGAIYLDGGLLSAKHVLKRLDFIE